MANMDLMALLSTVVLVATIATTIFAVAAYAVSRGYTRKIIRTKTPENGLTAAAGASAVPAAQAAPAAQRRAPILKRYNPFDAGAAH